MKYEMYRGALNFTCMGAGFQQADWQLCSDYAAQGLAARELIEQLKLSPLKESTRAMEGLAEMDLLLEYLDIYGAVDKVCRIISLQIWMF